MKTSCPLIARAILPVLLLAAAATAGPPRARELANPEISGGEVAAHVRYLASDELQGRRSGTPENDRAADYIAGRFRASGLKPAGDGGSFFQKFPVFTGATLGEENRLSIRRQTGSEPLTLGADFLPITFTGNGRAEGEVVFAGYGISAPDAGYDDYKGVDVRGKIVLALRHTPDGDDNGKFGPHSSLWTKTLAAREKGAAAILFLTGPLTDDSENLGVDPGRVGAADPREALRLLLRRTSASEECGIPAAFVKRERVEALLKPLGKSLKDLQTGMAHGKPESFPVPGARVELRTDVIRQTGRTRNVLALLEGSDPRLKSQVVVIGAHYDHLGLGDEHSLSDSTKPQIHHGADDNASGTAGVLELAQYFAAHRDQAGRSLLFMAFSGEEMGLLGSAYWIKKPTIPLERVSAMVNLDMVGRLRNDTFSVIGADSSPAWKDLLDSVNKSYHFQVKSGGSGSSGFGGSDQQSFYARSIPVLFFFTGVHPDYHKPTDTADKVNAEGEAKLLRFVVATVRAIGRLPERPKFAHSQDSEPSAGPSFRVYLGTIPDYSESVEGVALTGVREGSPAEKGGLRAGDVLVEFDGKKIRNVQEYTAVLGTAKPDVPVKMVVLRKGERVTLTVTPAARRN